MSINAKTFVFMQKNLGKVLVVQKIVVPLHPLSLKNECVSGKARKAQKKEFFERFT